MIDLLHHEILVTCFKSLRDWLTGGHHHTEDDSSFHPSPMFRACTRCVKGAHDGVAHKGSLVKIRMKCFKEGFKDRKSKEYIQCVAQKLKKKMENPKYEKFNIVKDCKTVCAQSDEYINARPTSFNSFL
jgi:hypothetical protein